MKKTGPTANQQQSKASDPSSSAWVSANAGSGKTHVLVNRVIRLMLTGTAPEKILCLTYTKAAAAEMSNRLFERLSKWIPLDDNKLIEQIHVNTGHVKFAKDQLSEPRRLFARALETPGGLKIQTIHAFCEQLLHQFPLEAGVTAGFKVMDERQSTALMNRIKDKFFARVENAQDQTMKDMLDRVIKYSGGLANFDRLLENLLAKRRELRHAYKDLGVTQTAIATRLEISVGDTKQSLCANLISNLDRPGLLRASEVLLTQSPIFVKVGQQIQTALNDKNEFSAFEALANAFLVNNATKIGSRLFAKGKENKTPDDIADLITASAMAVLALNDKIKNIEVLNATIALLNIGKSLTAQYDAEKNRLGFYDYLDLISRVLDMFSTLPDAAWVLFRLDGGLDHILIDEAQDTSPEQWEIIRFLADDFFSGLGAREDTKRSVFAVGDAKQSIYSFQGAAPKAFNTQKTHFEERAKMAGFKFDSVDFKTSFRSTSAVLEVVDQVFNQDSANFGVGKTDHIAHRKNEPGLVELWPIEPKAEVERGEIWDPENAATSTQSSIVRLSRKIALKIDSWFKNKETLESTGEPIQPQDILILVRKRTQIMPSLVRALKQLNIPIAGMDRLKLTEHIAVQDLLALCQFTQMVHDDLVFASLLKSTLLSKDDGSPFEDDDLIALASRRGAQSLWQAFLKSNAATSTYAKAQKQIENWIKNSYKLLPFEFFSSVLVQDDIRKKILTRLGHEANEPLDGFLDLTKDYEKSETATLQGFLNWIATSDTEIKREMEESSGEVRIMTIHGAKGLESKIVILPDTFSAPDRAKLPNLLDPTSNSPIWEMNANMRSAPINQLKDQLFAEQQQEYNRLLYVAMTRASDRLYIGAAETGKGKLAEESWYKKIQTVLERSENRRPDPIFGHIWRYEIKAKTSDKDIKEPDAGVRLIELPNWATTKPKREFSYIQQVAPSHLGRGLTSQSNPIDEAYFSPMQNLNNNLFLRGQLIHQLLQYLPEIAPGERKTVADRFFDLNAKELSLQERNAIFSEAIKVMTHEVFGKVFSTSSRSEVPVVAKIKDKNGNQVIVNGQIDRLIVDAHEVLIVDFKTNRPPAKTVDQIDPKYVSQLAAYSIALAKIYPGRQVRAGLLWTNSCILMEVPGDKLQSAINV